MKHLSFSRAIEVYSKINCIFLIQEKKQQVEKNTYYEKFNFN